jgi:hypothetical protein
MTCTTREADLALYVEGDLPEDEVPTLESHLAGCEACRGFLADLRESQGVVRALAAEPMAEEALATIRSAVRRRLAAEGRPQPWRWAAAAALAALAIGGSWLWWRSPVSRIAPAMSASIPPTPRPEALARPPERALPPHTNPGTRSTLRAAQAVSPNVAHTTTAPALSQEDADQLARAVVAVSRIERIMDADAEAGSPSTLVRLTTDDPKIVIYWQLDSNGGT